jgi:hypothetical protein
MVESIKLFESIEIHLINRRGEEANYVELIELSIKNKKKKKKKKSHKPFWHLGVGSSPYAIQAIQSRIWIFDKWKRQLRLLKNKHDSREKELILP